MESQSNKNIKVNFEGIDSFLQDGFSSEEMQQEQIVYAQVEQVQDIPPGAEENKLGHYKQQTRQVITKIYSLQPDMIGGWTPKIQFSKPIPLIFSNAEFDLLVDTALSKKKHLPIPNETNQFQNVQVCYLGARYQSTYYAWYDKQFQFPYKHLNAPKNIFFTDRSFVGQHWDAQKSDTLRFDSLFQSGNLDCAIKVGENQYDLFMRVDSNTKGHLQWFNFRVFNMEIGKPYKINICNFQKGKNLYNRGMRPFYYSARKYENEGTGWHQLHGEVKYRKKISKSEKFLEFQMSQRYFQLSFEISTKYQKDELQLAYCVPYTYSRIKKYLNDLKLETYSKNICSIRKLCTSLGGHEVDELTITENSSEQESAFKSKTRLPKKIVFITGRCHPGESNGSWMVEGLIDFLCGATETANFLRKNVIFKIIPMLNPDGVILGNYRTGLFGKDFNRQFHSPDKDIFPEVFHLKQMFWNYKKLYSENAFIYLDFHGHSIKKNVFAYGPEYPITHKNYYEARMISKFIAIKSKMFRYHSCIFKIAQSKQSTGRAIFLKSHKIPFTFTIEASNGSYYDQDSTQNKDFDEFKWKEVGQKVIQGTSDYLKLVIEIQRIRNQKFQERKEILMKNRDRLKVKKAKNHAELGYLTSMGFRKCKTLNSQEAQNQKNYYGENQNYFVEDIAHQIKGLEQNERLKEILEEIKKQKDFVAGSDKDKSSRKSDDEISQGDSDQESAKDDLDETRQKELLLIIKQRKKSKINTKRALEIENINKGQIREEEVNEQEEQQLSEKVGKINAKMGTKDILMRKYLWRKKNSAYSSLSPKKEDQSFSTAAKIVNFNFSLNPVECTSTLNNNNGTTNSYASKSTSNCLNLKSEEKGGKSVQSKNNPRIMEYSQTFKKTFISVQKQILRRDSYKRYLVSVNNQSQGKQKNNWLIENIRGKRIGQLQTDSKYTSKEQQRNVCSQGKSSDLKSGKKCSNKYNRNLKTSKEPIESEIIDLEIQDQYQLLNELNSTSKDLACKGTFSLINQQKIQFK